LPTASILRIQVPVHIDEDLNLFDDISVMSADVDATADPVDGPDPMSEGAAIASSGDDSFLRELDEVGLPSPPISRYSTTIGRMRVGGS
jgi:hypothetical protein